MKIEKDIVIARLVSGCCLPLIWGGLGPDNSLESHHGDCNEEAFRRVYPTSPRFLKGDLISTGFPCVYRLFLTNVSIFSGTAVRNQVIRVFSC